MPYKNVEDQKAWQKRYRQRPEYKAQRSKWDKKRKEKMRKLAEKLIGRDCFLCGFNRDRKKLIVYHEIHGNNHYASLNYAVKHPEDFVALCRACHRSVHQFMKVFGLKWEDFLKLKRDAES